MKGISYTRVLFVGVIATLNVVHGFINVGVDFTNLPDFTGPDMNPADFTDPIICPKCCLAMTAECLSRHRVSPEEQKFEGRNDWMLPKGS